MDAGKAQPIQSSHLSSMSPTQPISHEEQPRYEDPDAPLDLSLHPDVAAPPAPRAPYQGYQEQPAPQVPYQGYQEQPDGAGSAEARHVCEPCACKETEETALAHAQDDVELESSDDELPYIDPNMEPVQQRPVMFVSRVPAKKPRKLPWPTPKTHPVKRTNVKTSDRSDKAEAQSTPERPGPSEQSSVTVEPAHPTPVEMPMVILHQPPPVPKPVPVKPTPPPSRRRRGACVVYRGACVVYDDDVIEVIDVETTEDSSSVSQPNKPHRKHQDGFQRSGRRQKRAAPPTGGRHGTQV